ncbi:iron chelate uptake ABC transporter, FeCT family, permease protein [Peptostreptococcaceae bacterium oral taxon 113 str. W5053]|nr:iron chelate uptake ABC transporter, FeCT family, permease protein [Peptostreptococcaceae bacterium oral taxon 113 str. W5053]
MKKDRLLIGFLLIGIFLSFVLNIEFGAANVNYKDVLNVLYGKITGRDIVVEYGNLANIIWNLRVPRAIMAFVAGGGLAIAGVAMQSIVQNIMAEPYLFGVSSGATAAISVSYSFGQGIIMSQSKTSIVAFIGSVGAMVIVYYVGGGKGRNNTNKMILTGLSMSVLFSAVTQFFLIFNSSQSGIRSILSWTMGSMQAARWDNIIFPITGTLAGLIVFIFFARAFDGLSLGESTAISLGIDVIQIRKFIILAIAMVTASIVSLTGVIGFVGFIIPHIVRRIIGDGHRKLFPFSFLFGALFMLLVDLLAKTLLAPVELPIGIFTAVIGVPFFIYLIKKQGGR